MRAHEIALIIKLFFMKHGDDGERSAGSAASSTNDGVWRGSQQNQWSASSVGNQWRCDGAVGVYYGEACHADGGKNA